MSTLFQHRAISENVTTSLTKALFKYMKTVPEKFRHIVLPISRYRAYNDSYYILTFLPIITNEGEKYTHDEKTDIIECRTVRIYNLYWYPVEIYSSNNVEKTIRTNDEEIEICNVAELVQPVIDTITKILKQLGFDFDIVELEGIKFATILTKYMDYDGFCEFFSSS